MVIKSKSDQIIFTIFISGNTYVVNLNNIPSNDVFRISNKDDSWLWHRRITHIHMDNLNKLVCKDFVTSFQNMCFDKSQLYDYFQKGKQLRVSFKSKKVVYINRPLHLLHMDLFIPPRTKSFGKN